MAISQDHTPEFFAIEDLDDADVFVFFFFFVLALVSMEPSVPCSTASHNSAPRRLVLTPVTLE